MTMKLTVKLAGGLVQTLGFSEREIELPPGTTVARLLDAIGIDPARPVIVGRNGWAMDLAEEIREGDRILISPVFSGG
jgi:sulfur carrier protein ThiS